MSLPWAPAVPGAQEWLQILHTPVTHLESRRGSCFLRLKNVDSRGEMDREQGTRNLYDSIQKSW